MRKALWTVAVVTAVVAVTTIAPVVNQYLSVDRCLDKSGSFDYKNNVCETAANHPYAPDTQGHQGRAFVFWSAGVVSVAALVAASTVGRSKRNLR